MYRIESLLSARLFLVPQLVENRLYFISNLNGRNNLYVMNFGGSVPEPLLPGDIALQNPHHVQGISFRVFPQLGQILLMLDKDGDEHYQPMFIPMEGGYPQPVFGEQLQEYDIFAGSEDLERNLVYFICQSRKEPVIRSFQANLETRTLTLMSESRFAAFPACQNETHSRFIILEQFGLGDHVLYDLVSGQEKRLLYGTPFPERKPDQPVPPTAVNPLHFIRQEQGVLCSSILFEDTYSLCYLPLDNPAQIQPVTTVGIQHSGVGEMESVNHLQDQRYLVHYNIDGCSWLYEGELDENSLTMNLKFVLCGRGELANGVLEAVHYEKNSDQFALSFSTAVSPTQLYTITGPNREILHRHTNERLLGITPHLLSPGEDASYTSFDGLRISARLYLPATELEHPAPYPLVYYIHGGPQGQERPDFAWFSMPLIQFLTLNGFAVFVPNVRGSTGYGFAYMQHVMRDWGGQDVLDHIHAMTQILPQDKRLDMNRVGVTGRSYGGFMTLTLAGRYPHLWKAAIDMFGPYDLNTFAARVPATWKPYIAILVGDPETEQEFLKERSPRTYIHQLTSPMLVIQGRNDPRVVEQESRELAEELTQMGKTVELLVFEDEGHDVLKFENKVRCYNTMTHFFKSHLIP